MKTTIVIAGIGGVGGYFGGLLAQHYHNNDNITINFVARGAHLKAIQNHGLKVITKHQEFIAKPAIATDNPSDIGNADFIIVTTKSYALEAMLEQLRPCINQDTIILPLLNGVDSRDRIKNSYPKNIVLEGCAYIVSRLKQNGVIENSGNIQTLYFGLNNIDQTRLQLLENIFKEANIEAFLSKTISTIIWEKFIFISPTATATSYFNQGIGPLIDRNDNLIILKALIEEVTQLAKRKDILISEDITTKTLDKLKALPFETTSSMHTDFQNNSPDNELESLTNYVIKEGANYNIEMPTYQKLYKELVKRSK